MKAKILNISDDFRNIRGSFRIAGLIDIGTQASLVRRASGKYVFLDSYTLGGSAQEEIDKLTRGGKDLEAIINLHPFHTVHVPWMHQRYPNARHYGTARHLSKFPELEWQETCTEDPGLQALFEADFEFSVPRGVDFISDDPNLHFSSVLVFHRSSGTIHVDDTLMHVRLPGLMRGVGLTDITSFHPTLPRVLEKRAGAVQDFRDWAESLAEEWSDAENLCAAHTATLMGRHNSGEAVSDRILNALVKVRGTLDKHERKYG